MRWMTKEANIEGRLVRLEACVQALLDHFGVEVPDPFDEVRALAKRGEQIAAIRMYRAMTGASLKSAKMAVEGFKKER